MIVIVAYIFLPERGSHRLQASLCSEYMTKFPQELLFGNWMTGVEKAVSRTLRV